MLPDRVVVPAPDLMRETVALALLTIFPKKMVLPAPFRVNVLFPVPMTERLDVKVSVFPLAFEVIVAPEVELAVVVLRISMILFVVSSDAPFHTRVPTVFPPPN